VYVNGYMGPTISDLELKKRLTRHGARVVANFGRKSVTHVILGPTGLASAKIQKEMSARKTGVKYVTVDWQESPLLLGTRDLLFVVQGFRQFTGGEEDDGSQVCDYTA